MTPILQEAMPIFQRPAQPLPDDHYFEVDLTPVQRLGLIDILQGRGARIPPNLRKEIETAVLDARRFEGKLNRARLDWSGVEAEASRQGVGIVDILWDRMQR